eukprot:826477-Pyramimonas_sp.AAC.1
MAQPAAALPGRARATVGWRPAPRDGGTRAVALGLANVVHGAAAAASSFSDTCRSRDEGKGRRCQVRGLLALGAGVQI